MMDHTLEKIERFVLGLMTDEEANEFQMEINGDKALRKEVEKMQLISDAMELEIEDQLRAQLNGLRGGTYRVSKSGRIMEWLVAAVICLVLGLCIWFYTQSQPDFGQFVQNHYLSYKAIDLRSEDESPEISQGLALVRQGQVTQAIEWFENYLISHQEAYESRFILADLLQKSERNLEARDQFRTIADSPSLLWKEKAIWNELLLSAQYDWDVVADQRLKDLIADTNHSYHLLAIQLAEQLDDR